MPNVKGSAPGSIQRRSIAEGSVSKISILIADQFSLGGGVAPGSGVGLGVG
jgi:hypothetical protein